MPPLVYLVLFVCAAPENILLWGWYLLGEARDAVVGPLLLSTRLPVIPWSFSDIPLAEEGCLTLVGLRSPPPIPLPMPLPTPPPIPEPIPLPIPPPMAELVRF